MAAICRGKFTQSILQLISNMAPLMNLFSWALLVASSVDAISTSVGVTKSFRDIRREVGQVSSLVFFQRDANSQSQNEARNTARLRKREDTDPELLYTEYNFTTPVDHFHNETKYEPHSNATFPLRYWYDASHYSPGGPVIILQSGETDAAGRLVFMQKGILAQMAQATHGIAVVLEHRYYGTSYPTPDLSTENLRFLTTQQSLADEAYFAQNIKFPGLEEYGDLTSKTTAYLSYGGSYAGAFSAFLRVQYPDVFWGSISSSGVTKAIWDYWAYWEPVSKNAPQDCVATQKAIVNVVDNILIGKNDSSLTKELKEAFGLGNVTHDDDFAQVLSSGIENWQSLNWDPEVTSNEFYRYCDNITATDVLYPETSSKQSVVEGLIIEGGYTPNKTLTTSMLNMIGYLNLTSVSSCTDEMQDQCYSNHNTTHYQQDSYETGSWRSWPYQYCTEWGYLQTGNVPEGQLPLVSRTQNLDYQSIVCREAFNVTTPPDVEIINQYGAYDISYPRLAIIDGEWDPWRPATPHAFEFGAKVRTSTASEPFLEIPQAVHHWDENGLFPNQTTAELPPLVVTDAQRQLIQSVQEWMQEWELECMIRGGGCS